MINTPEHINIFIAYTSTDRSFLEELKVHLSVLERLGLVDKVWYNGLVEVGSDWEATVHDALHRSDIILLLVSADFIASDFCYHQEMKQAVRLHEEGRVRTIPIIVRPCLWERAPFAELEVLPRNGLPISSSDWAHADEPYVQITRTIEDIILDLKQEDRPPDQQKRHLEFQRSQEEAEHYFAAGKWLEAQAKYQQALHFAQSESAVEVAAVERRLERCRNEIYFQRHLARGEQAYREERFLDARSALAQALVFKPEDSEAAVLKAATEAALAAVAPVREEPKEDSQAPRFLQLKIFGIEVFKLVIAMSTVGLLLTPLLLLQKGGTGPVASLEQGGIVYRNADQEVVLRTDYLAGRNFSEGLAPVQNAAGKWGYIDEANEVQIEFDYDGAWPHSPQEDLAYVARDGQCGFIDRSGEVRIPLTYLDAASFSEGLAMVKKAEGDFAFIDARGRELISGLDSVITPRFEQGEAIVVRDGRQLTIDQRGRCVENCPEEREWNERRRKKRVEELLRASGKMGETQEYERALMKLDEVERLSTEGKTQKEVAQRRTRLQKERDDQHRNQFDSLRHVADESFAEGDFASALEGYRAADQLPYSGKQVLRRRLQLSQRALREEATPSATSIYGFPHPDGGWGIKNAAHEVLLPPQFDSVGVFSNGYLAIQKEGQWGFINEKGEVTIKPFYDAVVRGFSPEGFALVKKGARTLRLNRHGRTAKVRH
ncbi:MAG: WG repeat-containing protein [Bacteroidota bacterium]